MVSADTLVEPESRREAALKVIRAGLLPFVRKVIGSNWIKEANETRALNGRQPLAGSEREVSGEQLIQIILDDYFKFKFGDQMRVVDYSGKQSRLKDNAIIVWLQEMLEHRNNLWAHANDPVPIRIVDTFLDRAELIFRAASIDEPADQIRELREQIYRSHSAAPSKHRSPSIKEAGHSEGIKRPVTGEPIAILGPNDATGRMLARYPIDLAQRWRQATIDGAIQIFSCPHGSSPYGGFTNDQIVCDVQNKEWPDDFGVFARERVEKLAVGLVGDDGAGVKGWLREKRMTPGRIRVLLKPIAPPVLDRPEVHLALGNSDYFTVRTVTELARLNQDGVGPKLEEIFPRRWGDPSKPFTIECVPYHVSVQGVVICRADDGDYLLLASVNAAKPSITGGWGATIAEQMWAPDRRSGAPWWHSFAELYLTNSRRPETRHGDGDLRETLSRGLSEELGIRLGPDTLGEPLLLNAAIEQDMYFVTFIYIVLTSLNPDDAYKRWCSAPDHNELGLLAAYQLTGKDSQRKALNGPRRLAQLLANEVFDAGLHLLPKGVETGTLVGPWHCSSRLRMFAAGMHLWPDEFPSYVRIAS